jgi:putative DNA primase/helicase
MLVKGAKVGNLAVKVDEEPEEEPEAKPEKKKKKSGVEWVDFGEKDEILTTSPNLAALLDWMGYRPRRNLMNHQTQWDGAPGDIALECRQNAMAGVIIDEALRHGWNLPTDKYWRCLDVVEARGAFHPVVEWARSRPWDGRSRFGELFDTLTIREGFEGCHDLIRMQLEKWLLAGGRCLALGNQNPNGVAVQGVLVLQGKQDMGKTRWFESLLADRSWLAEGLTIDPSNKDHVIQATSSFLCELGELDATTRKSDVAQLKAFLTRSVDEYRAPFRRAQEAFPRRTLFGATVNPDGFLVDETGNRRFWVMPLAGVNANHGIDIQQLWAEAMTRAEAGETYWMPEEFKGAQLMLASRFQTRAEWADDFWHHFRLPTPSESGHRYRVSEVRGIIYGDRRFTGAEMRSFATFVRATGATTDMGQNVLHVRLVKVP